ncbi:PQQ-dependent sugar dehydrogenase [Pedobacter immunditicola]|uniref:PQQ-dependent sugar dehydrogenase n=1 Tax=Pedobacter immunditicola TaxID=3133440 RepID=UPI00309BF554
MKQIYLMLFIGLFMISCSPTRKQTHVLYFSSQPENGAPKGLKDFTTQNKGTYTYSRDFSVFSEDSLKGISAILIKVSDVNKLDHRAIPQLKRYLEAGGGGIIAIRDTTLSNRGWPWLQSWLDNQDGAQLEQDKGRLALLSKAYTAEALGEALAYVVGSNKIPDFEKSETLAVPDSSRYTREILAEGLDEPMQMAIFPNKDVLFVGRKGSIQRYENATGITKNIASLNVFTGIEDGLLGVALDPGYEKNNWIYFYYAVAGEKSVNRLSRFELHGDSLVLGNETVILEIPTQRIYCCHSAGYISFDKNGLLYLAIGDNTNAEETEGYTPVDERPGRSLADDQGTAANTNDLRGKILRIKPLPEGGYEVPEGNLFSKDGAVGRPEIYIMGSRNPYRFSIDPKTNYLYFGDVGPDTKVKASTGELMSFDEINQVKEPGFYGWPYFLGNNEIFPKYNYATKKEDPGKDPLKPINISPNNTGAKELPAAKPAMIWYGKGKSAEFPLVGSGGATAAAGPVYNSSAFEKAPFKLSDYYDGKLFIYEWIRGWIMAVTFDEKGNYLRMEPFLEHVKFEAPVDIQFAADGSLYVLEYGTNWFSKNSNAKLVRIQYVEGNRNPKAVIDMEQQYGAAPMKVNLSAKGSQDHDQADQLSYSWEIENQKFEGESLSHTFTKPGTYEVVLNVTDNHGGVGKTSRKVYVGNTPPEVSILTKANSTFYWDNGVLDYDIQVKDKEETVKPERLNVSFGYIPHGKDVATILTSNQEVSSFKYLKGKQMVLSMDCKSCHSLDQASVGPSYLDIAKRYSGKPGSLEKLANKVIQGGSGSWGERAMTAHPALSVQEAQDMTAYILSLSEKNARLPLKSTIKLAAHIGKGNEGVYLLNASYKDQGANGIGELESRNYILLKDPLIQTEDFDKGNVRIATITTEFRSYITNITNGKYMRFNHIDLVGIKSLTYQVQAIGSGGNIEVRLDKIDGPLVSKLTIPSGNPKQVNQAWQKMEASVKATTGKHDLFFVFTGSADHKNYFNVDWIRFQ